MKTPEKPSCKEHQNLGFLPMHLKVSARAEKRAPASALTLLAVVSCVRLMATQRGSYDIRIVRTTPISTSSVFVSAWSGPSGGPSGTSTSPKRSRNCIKALYQCSTCYSKVTQVRLRRRQAEPEGSSTTLRSTSGVSSLGISEACEPGRLADPLCFRVAITKEQPDGQPEMARKIIRKNRNVKMMLPEHWEMCRRAFTVTDMLRRRVRLVTALEQLPHTASLKRLCLAGGKGLHAGLQILKVLACSSRVHGFAVPISLQDA